MGKRASGEFLAHTNWKKEGLPPRISETFKSLQGKKELGLTGDDEPWPAILWGSSKKDARSMGKKGQLFSLDYAEGRVSRCKNLGGRAVKVNVHRQGRDSNVGKSRGERGDL